jgi:hypothetical protein
VVDIYNLILDKPLLWKKQYHEFTQSNEVHRVIPRSSEIPKRTANIGRIAQTFVLLRRHLHIIFNDKTRMILLLCQAPLLALLIGVVTNGNEFVEYDITKSLYFAMSCSALWVGILNSIQEVCKERNILMREYMTGLYLNSYMVSKSLVMGFICLIQSSMLSGIFAFNIGLPEVGIIFVPIVELLITTFLTSIAASAMGLFVSSLFKNADRAMSVAPIMLLPQLLFCGIIFVLSDMSKYISWVTISRWSMEAYGTAANLNALVTRMQLKGFDVPHLAEEYYTFTKDHLVKSWLLLGALALGFNLAASLVLKKLKNERK